MTRPQPVLPQVLNTTATSVRSLFFIATGMRFILTTRDLDRGQLPKLVLLRVRRIQWHGTLGLLR